MNIFTFTGHLGKDAEQRHTANGDSIVTFSVPATSGYGAKKKTAWIRCTMFGKRGESVLPYLEKGALVGVSGEFSMNEWTDKDGMKRSAPEVRVNELSLLGGNRNAEQKEPAERKTPPVFEAMGIVDFESDIPF